MVGCGYNLLTYRRVLIIACYHPVNIWLSPILKDNGKHEVVHNYDSRYHYDYKQSQRACGYCIGCRLAKSLEWAVRIQHEASLYWHNCWLTLTLNDDYLYTRENPYSVERGRTSEITRFLKRLRKKYGEGIRYYYCAEYGETCFFCNKNEKHCECDDYYSWRGRPHYHICMFNHDFDDKELYKVINGKPHYTSQELDALWTDPETEKFMGWATISELTPDNAAYTARYTMKKLYGQMAYEDDPNTHIGYYQRIDPDGRIWDLIPEYTNMSRGSKKLNTGGIGKGWMEQFAKEVMDNDSVLYKNYRLKPPRYYDDFVDKIHPLLLEENKLARIDKSEKFEENNTPERLAVREYIQQQKAEKLYRKEI